MHEHFFGKVEQMNLVILWHLFVLQSKQARKGWDLGDSFAKPLVLDVVSTFNPSVATHRD